MILMTALDMLTERSNMVIIALDFENREKTFEFLKKFNEQLYVKVGMELFYAEGPSIIKDIKALGHKIFLDLKCHDIPNTVKKAMGSLAKLDVDIINIHAAGGIKMMSEALDGLRENGSKALLIGVTQLTSTDKETMNNEIMIPGEVIEAVKKYALNAKKAGLNGVVCSPLEVEAIKEVCGKSFITVTPGIRPKEASIDDQKRITTPKDAKRIGCDFIVVGRPITKADNPVEAYRKIREDFTN
jgi:orotidine-5'-phosphate decarboxylase